MTRAGAKSEAWSWADLLQREARPSRQRIADAGGSCKKTTTPARTTIATPTTTSWGTAEGGVAG